jgi:polysaccharide export outer membrane protein
MAKVRIARAFRLPIIAAMTALALSGCMHAAGPVAMTQPQGDLDSLAYGPADGSGSMRVVVPLGTAVSPGDAVLVAERWF